MLLKHNTPEKLALAQAQAMQGMNPKFFVTSASNTSTGHLINDLMKAFPVGLEILENYGFSGARVAKKPGQQDDGV